MTRRHESWALSAMLGTLLLLGSGALPQAVLCIAGPDHLAVELVDARDCHSDEGARELDHDCPETCRDTPLGAGPTLRPVDPDATFAADAPPAATFTRIFVAPSFELARSQNPTQPRPVPTSRVGSVVLLC